MPELVDSEKGVPTVHGGNLAPCYIPCNITNVQGIGDAKWDKISSIQRRDSRAGHWGSLLGNMSGLLGPHWRVSGYYGPYGGI